MSKINKKINDYYTNFKSKLSVCKDSRIDFCSKILKKNINEFKNYIILNQEICKETVKLKKKNSIRFIFSIVLVYAIIKIFEILATSNRFADTDLGGIYFLLNILFVISSAFWIPYLLFILFRLILNLIQVFKSSEKECIRDSLLKCIDDININEFNITKLDKCVDLLKK